MNIFDPNDTTRRARTKWAKSIGKLVEAADRPQPLLRSMRPVIHRDVAAACAGPLTEIRLILADDSATVRALEMRRLRAFLTDGSRSPLFDDDPQRARQTARQLASAFEMHTRARNVETLPLVTHELRVPASAHRW